MRTQKWGLELEFTGITRKQAAEVLAKQFGTMSRFSGGTYNAYEVTDNDNRTWKVVSDASLTCQRKENGVIAYAGDTYSCELVTPICTYDDIPKLQEIVRELRGAGAFVNNSCGIHVHVDGANHTPKSVRNLINIVASKNDLLYRSLAIAPNRRSFCKELDSRLIEQMHRLKPQTMDAIEDIWYADYDHNRSRRSHYNDSRYHFLNLHSLFNGNGTVEWRGYNSTLHAGKVKAYIQLSLAMTHQALVQTSASRIVTQSDNPKYTFRCYLLRLGLIGDEFKTAREHLLKSLPGNIAWRDPAQAERQRERQRAAKEAERAKQAEEQAAQSTEQVTTQSTEQATQTASTLAEPTQGEPTVEIDAPAQEPEMAMTF
jgi:hypothetical protein